MCYHCQKVVPLCTMFSLLLHGNEPAHAILVLIVRRAVNAHIHAVSIVHSMLTCTKYGSKILQDNLASSPTFGILSEFGNSYFPHVSCTPDKDI